EDLVEGVAVAVTRPGAREEQAEAPVGIGDDGPGRADPAHFGGAGGTGRGVGVEPAGRIAGGGRVRDVVVGAATGVVAADDATVGQAGGREVDSVGGPGHPQHGE